MTSKLYTIISNTLWDSSLYFGHRYNRWVLASQPNAWGPCKCARFRAKQTYRNYSFRYLSRIKHFLKNSQFFSFKFFQGHNWLTNYSDSEFHGHWKTVTLSSISPNLSKHWRFLAFWLSLLSLGRGVITTWHLLRSPKILCYIVDWSICYPFYALDLR